MLELHLPVAPPKEQLYAFIEAFLMHLLGTDRPTWESAILIREISQPESQTGPLIRATARQIIERLNNLMRQILPSGTDDEVVIIASTSVIGQCLFHLQHRAVIDHMFSNISSLREIKPLARHITDLLLLGITGRRECSDLSALSAEPE
jgi:hypothetical protein